MVTRMLSTENPSFAAPCQKLALTYVNFHYWLERLKPFDSTLYFPSQCYDGSSSEKGFNEYYGHSNSEYRKCVILGAGTKEWLLLEWKSIACSSLQVLSVLSFIACLGAMIPPARKRIETKLHPFECESTH